MKSKPNLGPRSTPSVLTQSALMPARVGCGHAQQDSRATCAEARSPDYIAAARAFRSRVLLETELHRTRPNPLLSFPYLQVESVDLAPDGVRIVIRDALGETFSWEAQQAPDGLQLFDDMPARVRWLFQAVETSDERVDFVEAFTTSVEQAAGRLRAMAAMHRRFRDREAFF